MPKRDLTHLDARGRARMVDVAQKAVTEREAVASGTIRMAPTTMRLLLRGKAPKGDVLAAARIAGIQAAKRTPELIPLCHAIALTSCQVELEPDRDGKRLHVTATARARDRTGVEMEALTAVAVAALTVYDMLKAVDRSMIIESIALQAKRGGRSGDFTRAGASRSASPSPGRSRGSRAGSPARSRTRRSRRPERRAR